MTFPCLHRSAQAFRRGLAPAALAFALLVCTSSTAAAQASGGCWFKNGGAVPTSPEQLYPQGSVPDLYNPNHATRPAADGRPLADFVRKVDLGGWADSSTGQPVPTTELTPGGHITVEGNPREVVTTETALGFGAATWILAPCPPPPPYEPPVPGPFHFDAGLRVGLFGRETVYANGLQLGATLASAGFTATATYGKEDSFIRPGIRLALDAPFGEAGDAAGNYTNVDLVGSANGVIVVRPRRFNRGRHRWDILFTGGYSVARERAGKHATTLGYEDSEIMQGINAGLGVEHRLSRHLALTAEASYVHFMSQTFFTPISFTPTGRFDLQETALTGSVGMRFRFGRGSR